MSNPTPVNLADDMVEAAAMSLIELASLHWPHMNHVARGRYLRLASNALTAAGVPALLAELASVRKMYDLAASDAAAMSKRIDTEDGENERLSDENERLTAERDVAREVLAKVLEDVTAPETPPGALSDLVMEKLRAALALADAKP